MVGHAGGVRRLPILPALLAVAGLVTAAGCTVGFPPTLGPTGVDTIAVPAVSPDPAAYVARVDHPHLPLAPGARWELADADSGARLLLEVRGTRVVAGVRTTGVTATPSVGEPTTAWLAQDEAGHVWLLAGEGPTGAWATGEAGTAAGLVLAAAPRTGDGHPLWARGGEASAAARVVATGGSLAVPWGLAASTVALALDTDPARPGDELEVVLGLGVGPVAVTDAVTGDDLVLVARG